LILYPPAAYAQELETWLVPEGQEISEAQFCAELHGTKT